MADFSFVVGVIVLPPDHVQCVTKSSEVHKPVVHGEHEGAHQEPNQHKRHLHPIAHGHREENHLHDGIGDRLHHGIDLVVDGRLCLGQKWDKAEDEECNSLKHQNEV